MATDFWNGTGTWSTDDAAWSDNSPPISAEGAEIQTGTDTLTSTATIASLQVDSASTLDIVTGGTLTDSGAATIDGLLALVNGGSVDTSGGLSITSTGRWNVDADSYTSEGGSNASVNGTLSNAGYLVIGPTTGGLGAPTRVTAAALVNTGNLYLTGNTNGALANTATLDIGGAAGFGTLGVLTGNVYLNGVANLEFASGSISTIAAGANLQLFGSSLITDASNTTQNSALTGLSMIAGNFDFAYGETLAIANSVTVTGGWGIDGDSYTSEGGSSVTITGTLDNASNLTIGVGTGGLGAPTRVTAAALVNTGNLYLTGNTNGVLANTATLDISSAAGFGTLGVLTGNVYLNGVANLEFASGSISTIAAGANLQLFGSSLITDASNTTHNSALTGLSMIAGGFDFAYGETLAIANSVTVTGGWGIDGDNYSSEGGSSVTITGTLDNASNLTIGVGTGGLGAPTRVTASALVNTGNLYLTGNTNGVLANTATLDISSAAGFGTLGVLTGNVYLNGAANLEFASGEISTIAAGANLQLFGSSLITDASHTTQNSALTGLSLIAGGFDLAYGETLAIANSVTVTGGWGIDGDSYTSEGGSSVSIAGTLDNASNLTIGVGTGGLGAPTRVTASALVNTGNIHLTGNFNGTPANTATLDIGGAAGFGTLGVLTGNVYLNGAANLEFASGEISTIAAGANLQLFGSSLITDASNTTQNSALTGLSMIAGGFDLAYGETLAIANGVTVTGGWGIDGDNYSSEGGSSVSIAGTLDNASNLTIGVRTGGLAAPTRVTASALVNAGNLYLTGNFNGAPTNTATLDISSTAGFGTLGVLTGNVYLNGTANLEFASGEISTIVAGANLQLFGSSLITDASNTTQNSALTGLSLIAGGFDLAYGETLAIANSVTITGGWGIDGDSYTSEGGSSVTIAGTLTNDNNLTIGPETGGLSSPTILTVEGLVNAGVIQITGNGTVAVATLQINGAGTNSATVNIDGSGIVQMGTGDIYTQAAGATNIASGGRLAGTVDVTGGAANIAAGGTLAGTANVTGGSLDGTGTVAGTVNDTSGGTVFGGPSIGTPGTLTVSGTYNQSGTGDLEANIGSGGTSSGVVADTGGFVNLTGGTLSVSGTPAVGSVLTVMTFGGGDLVGQFAAVQDGASIGDGSNVNLGDGTTLEVFYNNDSGNIQIERVNNSSLVATYNWTDATANWSTAADWSGGQVPNPTANVVIGNTATGNVTLNGSSGDTTVNSLSILASNALTISGVTLTSATGGGGISVAANATLSLSSGEIDGSTLSGAGLLQTTASTSVLAGDTISAGTSFIGQNSTQTELLGAIDNAGTLEQFGGNGQNGVFLIGDAATLTGGGTVTLSTNPTNGGNAIIDGNGATLTNTNNTIQGSGIIGNGNLVLVNGGVIDATQQGGLTTLTLNGGGITNTGTMEAAAGAALVINNSGVVDNAGGTIKDLAATSTVELVNATIQGGTLNDTAKGTLETIDSAELDGSTHGALTITTSSTYTATGGSTTYLLGSIVNDGLILVNGGNGQNTALDDITTPVTLSGGGTVTLDTTATNGGSAIIEGNAETLTNTNNTIQGTGIIGNGNLILINQHIIDATPDGGSTTLTLNGGNVTNTDLLEATAGGVLVINVNTVDNASANITVSGATSTVELSSATVQGGTLTNTGGGTLETVGSAELDGSTQGALTLSTGSTYTANDDTTTYLLGSIVNDGLIQMNGGNGQNEVVDIITPVTLSGGGTLTMDTVATNGGSAFLEGNGETLTNTNNTIQGTGVIGNGNLVLINQGLIDATPEGGTSTLTLNGGGVTNTSTMEASAGGVLVINTTVNNAGGNITTADATSTVDIAAATVEGGTLNNTTAGGTFETTAGATLDGSTHGALTISTGSSVTATNNTTTNLLGTINNEGLLEQIGGNGQNGFLNIVGATTLTGGGTVTLDTISTNGANAYLIGNGATLTNTNNTIQGTGIIGNGSLALINEHLIDATPEGGTSTLTLNGGGGITNTSTMEASAGGVLVINTTVNNAGGNITTADATSTVEIFAATVEGGTLNNTAGGTFETTAGATLDGSTHGALTISTGSSVTATNNTTTYLLGTINNKGMLEQIGGNGQNGFLNIAGAVTLTGGGTVTLDDIAANGANAFIQGNGEVLTNTNNTIQGTGIIGNGSLGLVNGGVIDATPEGGSSTLTLNGSGTFASTGTLEATGGATLALDLGAITVSGLVSVAASSALDLTGELTVNGTLANFGAVSGGGATEVAFGSGTDRLILGPAATFGGTVAGGGINTTLELAAGTGGGTLTGLGTAFTNFGTVIVDAGATWTVDAAVSLLATTTFIGDGALSTLALTNAGTFSLANVSNFGTIDLAAGNNTVTVTDKTLSGGAVTINDGTSGNDNVSAAGDTSASKGKSLTYNTGTGTDSFTGGFENDTVSVSAAAVAGDTLTGGSGTNTLVLTSAGVLSLGGVSKFATIDLAAGNSTVTVTDALLPGGALTINDGASGNNTVSAAGDTSASKTKMLTYNAGSGTDSFTGGFENDAVHVSAAAVGGDTLTGGSGANTLILSSAGAVNLGGVSKFSSIFLAAGNSTVTVTNTTLSGGSVTINDGASGNNSISAAGDTSASTGKTLKYFTGAGTDSFTGGFENDSIQVSAAAVGGDTLTGGSGTNSLTLSSAGAANLGGVSKFANIFLAAGNSTVTVTDKTLSGGTVTINDGASGNNTVSAAGDTSASTGKTLKYFTGAGTDSFTGGFESDALRVSAAAVGADTLTGGSGSNTLFLTTAGTANLGGISKFATIDLANGNSTVTVTDKTLSGGSVTISDGTSGNNSVSAAGDTSASTGKTLVFIAGPGTDRFTGGFENDAVHVSAAAVGGDTLTGGSATNSLILTSAGAANLGGVSKFGNIFLAAGSSTVTVTDKTLSGGTVTINDGASGNNSVSAAGDTSASTGKTLKYFTSAGTDSFTGGFENDSLQVSAAAVGGDTLTGGSGANTLTLSSAGAANLGGVSKFGTINLAAGNSTVTVTDKTLSGGAVTINDGTSGNNTISAAGDTSASTGKSLTYHAGSGTNGFTGGFENDTIYAGTGSGSYTAGSGTDSFVFIKSSLPSQTLNNFQVSTDDILVYGTHSAGGFDLGSTDNALNPTTPTAISVADFVSNASGDFTASTQRFAYDTTNGNLFYSATGSNTSESLVANLTGEPGFTASNLLFEH